VNIHAVNFTFGVSDYRRQLHQIRTALRDHRGPIIMTGDFNSWRLRRQRMLQQLVSDLNLEAPEYKLDNRVRMFGHALDHIYTRGFSAQPVISPVVTSSDHNPLVTRLGLAGDRR
jgi:endonuclease/exonuclease/phosphatase (EEP) superfamily protein YafD